MEGDGGGGGGANDAVACESWVIINSSSLCSASCDSACQSRPPSACNVNVEWRMVSLGRLWLSLSLSASVRASPFLHFNALTMIKILTYQLLLLAAHHTANPFVAAQQA